ncbi:hypothetical protein BRADI_3g54570v3, partial [Brachypodium distachyon]
MAPKRKNNCDDLADPEDDTMGSSTEFAKPVYLVAEHEDKQSTYSVFKINAAADRNEPPHARFIVAGLPGPAHGMSFVAAHSKHGSWIVGVGGGLEAGTIILDPSTLKTYKGPRFFHPKHYPIIIAHDSEVYASSRHPHVVPDLDFQPWFESFSFKSGVPSFDTGGVGGSWKHLRSPPFFPLYLNPYQFRNPPKISVTSYAVVDSYILMSPQRKLKVGTYTFHVANQTWEKVHNKNLPFVGQAVPLGGNLFAACSVSSNGVPASHSALVFHMSIKIPSSTSVAAVSTPALSIQKFLVPASEGKVPRPILCPLGRGSFCSIRLGSSRRSKAKFTLTTFQTENIEAILTA